MNRLQPVKMTNPSGSFSQQNTINIYGPAGCGKTRFLHNLIYDLERKGGNTVVFFVDGYTNSGIKPQNRPKSLVILNNRNEISRFFFDVRQELMNGPSGLDTARDLWVIVDEWTGLEKELTRPLLNAFLEYQRPNTHLITAGQAPCTWNKEYDLSCSFTPRTVMDIAVHYNKVGHTLTYYTE